MLIYNSLCTRVNFIGDLLVLSEDECQRVIVQPMFIWEASNDFFKSNDGLDFQSIVNLRQGRTLKYLDCLASKKSKTHYNESYELLLEISDTSYLDVCYQALDYAINSYPDQEPEENNVIYDKKCALYHVKVQRF